MSARRATCPGSLSPRPWWRCWPGCVFGAVGHGSATEHGSASVTGAVAKFTTLSYTGALLGPPAIGWLAEGVGLTWSLSSVLVVLAAVGGFAGWTSRALPAHREDQPPMTARGSGSRG